MELLIKLDDYEGQKKVNGDMVVHLKGSLKLNRGRIRTAKKRYL